MSIVSIKRTHCYTYNDPVVSYNEPLVNYNGGCVDEYLLPRRLRNGGRGAKDKRDKILSLLFQTSIYVVSGSAEQDKTLRKFEFVKEPGFEVKTSSSEHKVKSDKKKNLNIKGEAKVVRKHVVEITVSSSFEKKK
jgi:hypothetical protein